MLVRLLHDSISKTISFRTKQSFARAFVMKVAIQGQAASFHDIAVQQFFDTNIALLPCETFAETFNALEQGLADSSVVAIENSLYGSINAVYDLLLKHKFWICGEVYLRIEQCLLGLPGSSMGNIEEVYSHPVALAQCELFLDDVLVHAKRFEHHDTGGAAADIKQWGDRTKTAIASRAAAAHYGLEILAHEIETHKQNYTRFVVLMQQKPSHEFNANKTSLILGLSDHVHGIADQPGSLYRALGAFAKQNINLTKLQSRPLIGKAWHYIFYVDVDAGLNSTGLQTALTELKDQDCEVTILGSYLSGR